MLQHSPPGVTPRKVRQAARKQAAAAIQHWLDLEAAAAEPVRKLGVWPFLTAVASVGAALIGVEINDAMGPVLGIGGLLCAGASLGTIVERVRERSRLAGLARGAILALAQTQSDLETPDPEPPAPEPPEPPLPEAIVLPLERARAACAGIARIAGDPAWTRLRVSVKEHEASARAQLRAFEERARRIAMAGELLAPLGGPGEVPPHLQELAGVYQAHCSGLLSAAEVFERAQASLARALLALTAGSPGVGAADAALRDLGAAFESLAQVLESLGRPLAPTDLSQADPTNSAAYKTRGRLPRRG